jgi:hypothetical protein
MRWARMDTNWTKGDFGIRNLAHPTKRNEDRPRRGTKFVYGTRDDILGEILDFAEVVDGLAVIGSRKVFLGFNWHCTNGCLNCLCSST